jgi:outer membrane immunogenic protein
LPTSAPNNYCWLNNCSFSDSQTVTGVLGGIQIGYNFQSGQIVYGVEADFGLSSAKKSSTSVSPTDPSFAATSDIGIDSIGTARLRLGYAFDNNLMAYATGGLAYAKTRDSFQAVQNGTIFSSTGSGWRTGYTVGGGLEYMLNEKWSVKGEALYYDLGTKRAESTGTNSGFPYSHGITDHMTGVIARIGLNYLFH